MVFLLPKTACILQLPFVQITYLETLTCRIFGGLFHTPHLPTAGKYGPPVRLRNAKSIGGRKLEAARAD
jgi:hypothetical protein